MGFELLALLAMGVLFMSGNKNTPTGPSSTPASTTHIDAVLDLAQVGEPFQKFLRIVAYGESRLNPHTGLGIEAGTPPFVTMNTGDAGVAEAKAAARAYDNTVQHYINGPWPKQRYSFGSGGLFGMMPAYGLAAFWDTPLEHADPWLVFEPEAAVVMALAFARRLQGYASYQSAPTFAKLRAGWAAAAKMADPEFIGRKLPKWRDHARAVGVLPSFLDTVPPKLPKTDWVALYQILKGGSVS